MALEKFETLDLGVMQRAFEVNTLGPLRISKALVPLLASPGGKILIVDQSNTQRRGAIPIPRSRRGQRLVRLRVSPEPGACNRPIFGSTLALSVE